MKTILIIPTFWIGRRRFGLKKIGNIYDHPTPISAEGTLRNAIESIKILKDKKFSILVIAATTSRKIEKLAEKKVKQILESTSIKDKVEINLFSYSNLCKLRKIFKSSKWKRFEYLLDIKGYSRVRNIGMLLANVLGAEVIFFVDDDEYFIDPNYISEGKESLHKRIKGKIVEGVTGYYIKNGSYILEDEKEPWTAYWDKKRRMNEALKQFVRYKPKLKQAPFAFGGAMIIHKDLFRRVPFDPMIMRGEDVDYVINAMMFGFPFFLNNKLAIGHNPPPKIEPLWMTLRKDIWRFTFERLKLKQQIPLPNIDRISIKELDPYPGRFLRKSLDEKIYRSSQMLALEYHMQKNDKGAREVLNNIHFAKMKAGLKINIFNHFLNLQKDWSEFNKLLKEEKKIMKKVSKTLTRIK